MLRVFRIQTAQQRHLRITLLVAGLLLVTFSQIRVCSAQVTTDYVYGLSGSIGESGTLWQDLNRASGDPNCVPNCSCTTSNCASNGNNTQWLQALDFQDLPWEVTSGDRYIKAVRVNVNGRFDGGTGGHFEIRIIVRDYSGAVLYDAIRNPGNEFTNNSDCDWRIPAPERDLFDNVDWNSDTGLLDNIEVWVRRKGANTNTILINAFRVAVDSEPGPSCQISATSLNFGTTYPGGVVNRNFSIMNSGGGLLNGSIDASDCNGGPFSIVSGGGAYSLGAGQSRLVEIKYAPTEPSVGQDECSIDPNDTNFLCDQVELIGESGDPCEVAPQQVAFGDQGVFTVSERNFTVRNIGVQTFSGTIDASDCDDFQVISGGGDYSLSPGQSRVITVRFIPTTDGYNFCTITTGCETEVDISGNGLPASCQIDQKDLEFGNVMVGSFVDRSLTIHNGGPGRLQGTPELDASAAAAGFSIVSGGQPYDLGTGESRTVTIRFAPSEPGIAIAFLDPGTECEEIVLKSGNGVIPPICDAGTAIAGGRGAPVLFDGQGSADPDGFIVTYAWNFGDGGTAVGSLANYIYYDAGEYDAELCVTDNDGLARCCTTSVHIDPYPLTVNGLDAGDTFGSAVCGVGDVDGDGYSEILVGAPAADVNGPGSGMARLVSGADGHVIREHLGNPINKLLGISLAGGGDANQDGVPDYAVGAPKSGENSTDLGCIYVYSGADGALLLERCGTPPNYYAQWGSALSWVGDVNRDGHSDLAVSTSGWGPPDHDARGRVTVLSGADWSTLFEFYGNDPGDRLGFTVAACGDVNFDDTPDVGVSSTDGIRIYSGADGTTIRQWPGGSIGGTVGDINFDGYDDILIGYGAAENGRARVFSGKEESLLLEVGGDPGVEYFGYYLCPVGDFDGDGVSDFLVGAQEGAGPGGPTGRAYVFSGRNGSRLGLYTGTEVGSGFGYAVGSAGDVNGDGGIDIVVGAPWIDTLGLDCGSARIILGTPPVAGTGASSPSTDSALMELLPIYPNPSPGHMVVRFALPAAERVTIDVYDLRGQLMRRLLDSHLPPGDHTVEWDGYTEDRREAASGLYLYSIRAGSKQYRTKCILMR